MTQTLIVTSPNWGRIGRGLIMKKIYMQPTMTVVEIMSQTGLLAGSVKSYGLGANPLNESDEPGNATDEGV